MSRTRLMQRLRKLAIFATHGWRLRTSLSLLQRSGLFDSDYYLRHYPEVAEYAGGPLLHYAVYGASEGRNPSALFDEEAYRAQYPEVLQQGGIGLLHYLQHDENNPNQWFDGKWYKLKYPDVNAASLTPLAHYLSFGASEDKDPSTRFSTAYYRQNNPEVATSRVNPLAHFLEFGIAEGRMPVPSAPRAMRTNETIYYSDDEYRTWVRNYDTLDDSKRILIHDSIARLPSVPRFSIVLLPDAAGAEHEEAPLLESLLRQLYVHWELLIPTGSKAAPSNSDPRIRNVGVGGEGPIAAFNAALAAAQGDYVVPLPADAGLAEHALYELAVAIASDPEAALLYSDEDRIDASGERSDPWFKTGWDPCLALAKDSIGLLAAFQGAMLRRLGGMRPHDNCMPLALYELSLRAAFAASAGHIHHIPMVLCHRAGDGALLQDQHAERMRAIVRALLQENDIDATVTPAPMAQRWSWINREVRKPEPLVSIIVPTRDRADLLEKCTASLLSNTDYPALELLIVDNDSQEPAAIALLHRLSLNRNVRVLPYPGEFNYAAINNFAAREARGQILVLLNNDTESIRPDWLHAMVAHAIQPDIGAVGARLLYSDGRVQHAGMVNQPDGPVHQFRFAGRNDVGPMGELCLARSVTLVTGACLAIRRAVYFEVGGLDEDLRVAFNDVDLCMKLGDQGYRIVWTPNAELFHFESASRGYDVTPEQQALATRELERFKSRWGALLSNDPFRNPNLNYGWDKITLAAPPQRSPSWLPH